MSKLATLAVAVGALALALSRSSQVRRKPDGAGAIGAGGPGVSVYVGPRWGWYGARHYGRLRYPAGYPYAYYPYWRYRYLLLVTGSRLSATCNCEEPLKRSGSFRCGETYRPRRLCPPPMPQFQRGPSPEHRLGRFGVTAIGFVQDETRAGGSAPPGFPSWPAR